ncbi:putative GNAT family N-acyltransferase [Mucilaginibacter sp. UYP25]|uniref:GNAT family N-acetyltransferase n=1 Tax=unclassified Mucilaginibacter TaxID=2617802 RepID=UPI003390881E
MPSKIEVRQITNPTDLEKAFAIRHEVFVLGQNCPANLERANEEESHHFLVTVDDIPAGASRWRKTADGYKLERFAVLSKFRGFGVGQALVKAVLAHLPADAAYVYLNSQTPAISLYERFGFKKTGPEFEEAGMMHYKMVLTR